MRVAVSLPIPGHTKRQDLMADRRGEVACVEVYIYIYIWYVETCGKMTVSMVGEGGVGGWIDRRSRCDDICMF